MSRLVSDSDRIAVTHNAYGFELQYNDPNPETRYLPREQSFWAKLREAWRLGGHSAALYNSIAPRR